jgi:hypothetical protein
MRKSFDIDSATLGALRILAKDLGCSLETAITAALAEFLQKHGRPTDLKEALLKSLREFPVNDNGSQATRTRVR